VTRNKRLDQLTDRWRSRHDARRPQGGGRPRAAFERQFLAGRAFPYRTVTPAAYVAEHGADMTGFTYDDESYTDPELDAWLVEVGRLLRADR